MKNNKNIFINKNKVKLSNSIDKYKNKLFGLNENLKKNLNNIQLHKHKEKEQEGNSSRSPSPEQQSTKDKKEKQKEKVKDKVKEKQKEKVKDIVKEKVERIKNKNKASTSKVAASSSTTPESSLCNSPSKMDVDKIDTDKMDVDNNSLHSNDNTITDSDDNEKLNTSHDKLKSSGSTSSFEKSIPDIRKGNIKDMDIDFKSLIRRGSYQSDSSSTLYGNSKFNKKKQNTIDIENSQEKNKKMMETINVINNLVNEYIELINKKNKDSKKEVDENQQFELINLENFHNSTNHLVTLLNEDRFPLIALIGRRGSGKSSFVNAVLGKKVAELGNIRSQTGEANLLQYRGNNNSGMDILDTRGINEGQKPQEEDKYETPVGKSS